MLSDVLRSFFAVSARFWTARAIAPLWITLHSRSTDAQFKGTYEIPTAWSSRFSARAQLPAQPSNAFKNLPHQSKATSSTATAWDRRSPARREPSPPPTALNASPNQQNDSYGKECYSEPRNQLGEASLVRPSFQKERDQCYREANQSGPHRFP